MKAALAASILLLAGCAQVPTSGPIVEVDQAVTDTGTTSFVRVLARPPQPGMTPSDIVQGFLDAASGFEDGHAVAKEYLTDEAALQWNPSVGVRVYGNDTETLTQLSDTSVEMTAAQLGLISDRSQYIQSPPSSRMEVTFGLSQVNGQWRLNDVPQGLLLSRAAVERSYREFDTFYVAKPGGILAPNPVLFQSSQGDVSVDLVSALLEGPSRWLAPTVTTAFPPGTQVRSVSITDGIATIDFTPQITQSDTTARQQLSAQLIWTMRQIASIRAVSITAEGQPLDVPSVPNPQPRTAWAEYDPDGLPADARYYVARAGRILTTDAAGVTVPVPGAAGSGEIAVTAPLISLDQTTVAATDSGGSLVTAQVEADSRWRSGPPVPTRKGSYDRTGLLWVVADGEVQVVNVLGARTVDSPLPGIESVQISRDGSRALVVSEGRPYLLRVDRSADTPVLAGPRLLADIPVRAAVWGSATSVGLLTEAPGQPSQVVTVDLGLFTLNYLGGPPRARTLAAAPDRPLLSGTADGQVWSFSGSTWVPLLQGRAPRYPG